MKRIRNKRIWSIILAVAMVMCSAPLTGFIGIDAYAYTDGMYEYTIENGEATIVGCNEEPSGDIVIPETLGGYPVVSIKYFGLEGYNEQLKSVSFPSTLKTIGRSAFCKFYELESIELNDGLEVIERDAFSACENLEKVVIPDTVTCISDCAFWHCTGLKTVDLGNSVNLAMDYDVFSDCNAIESFSIGEANVNYCTDEYGVLYNKNKTGLIKYPPASSMTAYTVDENTAYINEFAFACCVNLKKVNLPDNLISIGDSAFINCDSLEEIVIPEGTTNLGGVVFYNCDSLKKVTLPGSIGVIKYSSFYECANLKEVNLGEGLKEIGNNAFMFCTSLEEITIPDTVEDICWNVFSCCENLRTVDLGNAENLRLDYHIFTGCPAIEKIIIGENNKYYCTDEKGVLYNKDKTSVIKYVAGSSATEYTVDENTLYINEYAFEGASALEKINIPAGLMSIGQYAFKDCTGIEEIVIPEGTYNISDGAFQNCASLRKIVIPDSVRSIGNDVFEGCTSLTDIITGENENKYSYDSNGVLYNEDKTVLIDFPDNSPLESFIIPDGVKNIGNKAFLNCYNLKSVSIPDSVTTIGSCAFEHCNNLTAITIPDGVTAIGSKAFSWCYNLELITLPDSVMRIGRDAFIETSYYENPDNWENRALYIGNHLVRADVSGEYTVRPDTISIADYAFDYCQKLAAVKIPEGVKSIGDYAFFDCENLKLVTIPDSLTYMGWEVFDGCSSVWHILYEGTEEQWNNVDSPYYSKIATHCNTTIDDFSVIEKVEQTCEKKGYTIYGCSVCDDEYTIHNDGFAEHVFENGECVGCGGFEKDLIIESDHPYSSNCDKTWTVYRPGAESISLTFSKDTYVEWGFDRIYIDWDPWYSNLRGAFYKIAESDDPEIIRRATDYVIEKIAELTGADVETAKGIISDAISDCEEIGSDEGLLLINCTLSRLEMSGIDSDTIIDEMNGSTVGGAIIGINSGYTGNVLTGKTVTVVGDTVKIRLVSNEKVNDYGFKAHIQANYSEEDCTHSETEIRDAVEATCTEAGYTGDTYCADCDELLEEGEVTDALGHTWGEWETVTEATEADDGEKQRACSACGEKEKGKIPASGIHVTLTDSDGNIVEEKIISGNSTEVIFDGVENSEYTISFSKENYVTRNYMVSASDGRASTEFSINKVGDLNGDGKVNTIDVARANAHAKSISTLYEYELACADVNGDNRINTVDVAKMNAHAKGVSTLW